MEKITLVDEYQEEVIFYLFDKFKFENNEYFILSDGTPLYYLLKYQPDNTLTGIDDIEEYHIIKNEYNKYREGKIILD